jgi:hypothetical protein
MLEGRFLRLVPLVLATGVAAAIFACSNDENSGTVACGSTVCGARQTCDTKASPPSCRCQPGYAGADCGRCASGYRVSDTGLCVEIPIDCNVAGICGPHGSCIRETVDAGTQGTFLDDPSKRSTKDSCRCAPTWDGRVCDECASGLQDFDQNGTCVATCATAGLSCEAPATCNDLYGQAFCQCPTGTRGDHCELCFDGMARVGDGPCLPTCSRIGTCGPRSHCEEETLPAACVCDIGFTGPNCDACAPGFTAGGPGVCAPQIPPADTLLATATIGNQRALVAIDPSNGAIKPVRHAKVNDLAWDPGAKKLYATERNTSRRDLYSVDLASGALTKIVNLPWGDNTTPIAWNSTANALFSYKFGEYVTMRIDVGAGTYTQIGTSTGVSWPQGLAYLPASDKLLLLRNQGGGGEYYLIDPATGVATPQSSTTPAGISSLEAVTVEPASGHVYALAQNTSVEDVGLFRQCARLGEGLGYGSYAGAPAARVAGTPAPVVLRSSRPSGKELVSMYDYGSRTAPAKEIVIAATNPEAGLCVMTYEQRLAIRVEPSARFAFLVIIGPAPTTSVSFPAGYPVGPRPVANIVRYGDGPDTNKGPPDPSLYAYPGLLRVYSQAEFEDRRLTLSYSDETPSYSLVEYDAAYAPIRTVPLTGDIGPGLTGWKP